MKKIIRLNEDDLSRIVKKVIMEENPTTGKSGITPPKSGNVTSTRGVKTITPKITIDCSRKLITSSQLPKLNSREANLAMNQGLVAHYCQPGK